MNCVAPIDTPFYRYGALSEMLSGVRLYPAEYPPKNACSRFFVDLTQPCSNLFCNKWSIQDIADTFLSTGCFEHWKNLGYSKIWIELSPVQTFQRYELNVWTQIDKHSELLMQLVVWLEYVNIERLNAYFPAFCVEHLRLQRPCSEFTEQKLPGQDFPSSGMLRRMFGILKKWACEIGAEIITEIPEYFHTAYLFSEYFTFIDPEMETLFQAMKRDLMRENTNLADVSFAFENEKVVYQNDKWLWPTEMQAFGLSHELNQKLKVNLLPNILQSTFQITSC